MGESHEFPSRYARPGEIDTSILESQSFKQRLGVVVSSDQRVTPDRRSPVSSTNEARVGVPNPDRRVIPDRRSAAPLASDAHLGAGVNLDRIKQAPLTETLESKPLDQRLSGELNPDSRNPPPSAAPRGVQVHVDRVTADRRSPAPPSNEARQGVPDPDRRGIPDRRSPAPLASEANLGIGVNPEPAKQTPITARLLEPHPGLELNPDRRVNLDRRSRAPFGNEARLGVPSPDRNVVADRRSPAASARDAHLGQQVNANSNLNPERRGPAPLIQRDAVVRKRVSARFDLLPDPPSRWNRIGWSAAAQLATLALLLLSPTIFPQEMQTALKFDYVELMQPVTHIELPPATPPPPPPKIKPRVPPPKPIVPKPVEVEPPQLNPKQPHVFLVVKPQLPKVHTVDAKPVELKPMFAQVEIVLSTNQPKRPKEEMKAPILQPMRAKQDIKAPDVGLGGPLPATILAAANKVQTGGFGDPHGIRGPANPGKAANINQAGSPNLPGGPGYGNGSGGAQGLRGTLASDGSKGGTGGTPAMGAVSSSVDILYEPNPAYTNEARVLKMEGDIVLEVVFLASGQVQVTRVVSGLGHGLDEAAIQAAKQIRFRPAKRNGQPVDFPAHVRIEFRLAK